MPTLEFRQAHLTLDYLPRDGDKEERFRILSETAKEWFSILEDSSAVKELSRRMQEKKRLK